MISQSARGRSGRWVQCAWAIALAPLLAAQAAGAADPAGAVVSGQAIEQALQDPPRTRGLVVHAAHDASSRAAEEHPAGQSPASQSPAGQAPASQPARPSIALSIPFQLNSSDLQPQATAQLAQLQVALSSQSLARNRFLIAGHTDATGDARYNQQLSERRAAAVKEYLVAKGIAANRLETAGYGAGQLLLPNRPDDPLNRRVEIRNLGELP